MRANRLFMWDYQDIFRVSTQVAAEGVFKMLDLNLRPTVFLVGAPREEGEKSNSICLEPENECGYTPAMFSNVKELAKNLQSVDEENSLTHNNLGARERHEKRIETKALRNAILKVIESQNALKEVISFCSWPVLVQGYMVCVVLQFPRKIYESHYSLIRNFNDRFAISVSLLDATVVEFLAGCAKTLTEQDPGAGLNIIDRDYEEVIRTAGKRLMNTPASYGQALDGLHGLFETCNAISSLRYEGAEGRGTILIARKNHPNLKLFISLKSPVSMRNYRAVRKLLELSNDEFCLVSDSAAIYGLGTIIDVYNPRLEDLYTVKFTKHYTWELCHAENLMMRVAYGQPTLPSGQIDQKKFKSDVKRIFPIIDDNTADDLWRLVNETLKQTHGAMLVISSGAREEAERLHKQSTNILPMKMTPDILRLVSAIDGAILIDPEAMCHAIGVILDGLATEKGDPSRGARFNSAIRYVESTKYQCLVIVVSEDGLVNLIPDLKPQLERSQIDEKIFILKNISGSKVINTKQFNKIMEWLINHKFYLLPEMCAEINALRREIEKKMDTAEIKVVYQDLLPDPEMNISYFLE